MEGTQDIFYISHNEDSMYLGTKFDKSVKHKIVNVFNFKIAKISTDALIELIEAKRVINLEYKNNKIAAKYSNFSTLIINEYYPFGRYHSDQPIIFIVGRLLDNKLLMCNAYGTLYSSEENRIKKIAAFISNHRILSGEMPFIDKTSDYYDNRDIKYNTTDYKSLSELTEKISKKLRLIDPKFNFNKYFEFSTMKSVGCDYTYSYLLLKQNEVDDADEEEDIKPLISENKYGLLLDTEIIRGKLDIICKLLNIRTLVIDLSKVITVNYDIARYCKINEVIFICTEEILQEHMNRFRAYWNIRDKQYDLMKEKMTDMDLVLSRLGQLCASCDNINKIYIPDGITCIGERIFEHCSGLEHIRFPDTLKDIKKYAFSNCNKLSIVRIPKAVVELNTLAFKNCKSLAKLIISHKTKVDGNDSNVVCRLLNIEQYD